MELIADWITLASVFNNNNNTTLEVRRLYLILLPLGKSIRSS